MKKSDTASASFSTDRILRWPEVRERTGLSRTTAWREIRACRFPASVEITPHSVGWRESDIAAWLAARKTKQAA
jgi:prophage regulatory protein